MPAAEIVRTYLDRFTSGAILFAATAQDRDVLIKQFLEQQQKEAKLQKFVDDAKTKAKIEMLV